MRSLLFVPGDSPKKLDKGMTSGADALIVDLEDSVSAANKAAARKTALDFITSAKAAAPDAIMLPKAEGGASVIHVDAKLAVREAENGLPENSTGIVAIATETATALFLAATFRNASQRLTGLTWGAEDLSADLGA